MRPVRRAPSLGQRIHIENPHGFVRVMPLIDHESSCTDRDQRTGRAENGGHVSGPDTASRADTVLRLSSRSIGSSIPAAAVAPIAASPSAMARRTALFSSSGPLVLHPG